MPYVTTNLRLPTEDWRYFKLQAFQAGKSLSAWIRDVLKEKTALASQKRPLDYTKDYFWKFPKLLKKLKIKDKAPKDLSLNLDKYLYG